MKDEKRYGWPADRRVRLSRWMTVAVLLLASGVVAGAWACGPGGAAGRPGVATQALIAAPVASPAATPPAAPPAAPAPAPKASTPGFSARTLDELDRALASAMAAGRAAEREEEARRAAASRPATASFAVAERMEMSATMYCLRGNMRTGVRTRDGMAAGDPRVLPLGSVVRLTHPDGRLIGIFVIMDTGGAIKGNKIDIYVDSCPEAIRWGRRPVITEVLSTGRATRGDLR
ncbi:MAG TPA: 3D domain-containing protein [Longimicrobium sp.]|nr:3D domain-containing protein [Longimicrobium sp.]